MKAAVLLLCLLVLSSTAQSYNYCQAPLPQPSEKTQGMTLQMVQVITRHGDRTPTQELPQCENPLVVWNCTLNSLNDPDSTTAPYAAIPARLYRKLYLPNREVLPGDCELGQLTDKGLSQHQSLGSAFRNLYVNTYKLLPSTFTPDLLWTRTTDVPRTFQSAQGNLQGLYPANQSLSQVQLINIYTVDSNNEDMYSNDNVCPRYNEALAKLENSPEWLAFDQQMQPLVDQLATIFNTTVYNVPDWVAMVDVFFARQCHSLPLPYGITQDILNQIFAAANWEWTTTWEDPDCARLGMSPFLAELYENIQNFIAGEDETVYYFYSGHDTTVGPLTALLGVYDGLWPPYASHCEMELWSNTSNPMEYYVQFKYNGQSYVLPGCSDVMCPYKEFESLMANLIPEDLSEYCMLEIVGEQTVPRKKLPSLL